jgi:hypothetical protein
MSKETKEQVLARLRRRYRSAGLEHKARLLDQAVELLGYHRKSAVRALRAPPPPVRGPGLVLGRPKSYRPETLLPVLKVIWLAAYLGQRPKPVLFTRARPYRNNDDARVEQRNWTRVRQPFGYERYDHPEVAPLLNALCKGPLGQLQNHFLPTLQLEAKRRQGPRQVRLYGPALTPYARLLAAPKKRERGRSVWHKSPISFVSQCGPG